MTRHEKSEKPGARFGALRLGSALGVLIPSVLLLAYSICYHEPWADSAQTLLLGRHVPWSGFIHAMRLEGAPPLYHLLNWFLCLFMPPYVALALAGAIGYATLLAGTLHLLHIVSGRPRASLLGMLLLAATNVYVYELGMVSRPYGIGMGLILLGIAELLVAHRLQRPRRAVYGALFCGLAAMTSAHAGCVAGAALASYALVQLVCRRSLRTSLPTLWALPFFIFLFYIISPNPEREPGVASAYNPHMRHAWEITARVLGDGAIVYGWWAPASFSFGALAKVYPPFLAAMGMISLVAIRRRWPDRTLAYFVLGLMVLSWSTLLYIFVAWYTGVCRHHLFLWIPAIVLALGSLLGLRARGVRYAVVPFFAACLWAPWWVYQYWVLGIDLREDYSRSLTDTKAMAALVPKDAHVVADHDYAILGMLLWREDITLRSPDRLGTTFKYLIVDRQWRQRVGLERVVRQTCAVAPDRTMFVHNSASLSTMRHCLRQVRKGDAHVVTERATLYEVNCSCMGR